MGEEGRLLKEENGGSERDGVEQGERKEGKKRVREVSDKSSDE